MRKLYPHRTPKENRWLDGETIRRSPSCGRLVYEDGWEPTSVVDSTDGDTVVITKDGEEKTFSSDHIAFHRFVEGLKEDFGL